MYNRQLPAERMERFRRGLDKNARREPMDVSYHMDLYINGIQYRLQMLIEKTEIIPIQAIRMDKDIRNCELITRPTMLAALTELALEQSDKQ